MYLKLFLPIIIVIGCFTACRNETQSKNIDENENINVLLLSGSSNHNWELTTRMVKRNLENAGIFSVTVTEQPDTLNSGYLEMVDVIVSDWNTWPQNDYTFPESTEKALSDFIRNGNGMVFFHSSGSALYNWDEFFEFSLARWETGVTGHGKPSKAKVFDFDQEHPITRGLSEFYVFDEIWEKTEIHPDAKSIAEVKTTLSGPEDQAEHSFTEPAVLVNQVGKGRSCYIMFGHGDKGKSITEDGKKTSQIGAMALYNSGVITLFNRAVEWAATNKVTIPVADELDPVELQNKDLSWQRSDTTISLMNKQEIIWQYNYNTQYSKSFFHPLRTSAGTLSCLAPYDHPWHLGLWFSWKFINGVNYWEADRKTHESEGKTAIKEIKAETKPDYSAEIEMEIEYYKPGEPPVLGESRTIYVSPPQNDGYYIDYAQNFTALEDVKLDRTPIIGEPDGKTWGGYAGLSMRFSQDMMNVQFVGEKKMDDYNKSKGEWLCMGGEFIKGGKAGICIYPHPENNSENMRWYIFNESEPRFQYFSPAILFDAPSDYKKGENFTLKYRVWVIDGEADVQKLSEKFKEYAEK